MREATLSRKTKETDIRLSLALEGGEVEVSTTCSPPLPSTAAWG